MALSISGLRVKDRNTVEGGGGSGDMPTFENTGPASGTSFSTITGDYHTSDDEVLTARHITGSLYLDGDRSGAIDCQIDGGVFIPGPGGVPADVFLTRCSMDILYNTDSLNGLTVDACFIGGDDFDATLCQIADGSGAQGAQGLVIRNSYFYGRPSYSRHLAGGGGADPHWEAIHPGGAYGVDITNNVFDFEPLAPSGSDRTNTLSQITACVVFEKSFSGSTRQDGCSGNFSGNYLLGGSSYQLYCNLVDGSTVNNNSFTFGGDPVNIAIPTPDFTQSGNTLNGAPYTI